MGPNNTIFYQYAWNDDRSAIVVSDRESPLRINQGDQREFLTQRGFQDRIMSSVREHAGIPTGLDAAWRNAVGAVDFLFTFGAADHVTGATEGLAQTILTNISKMTDIPADKTGLGRQFTSREVMLALHDVSEHLPDGMKTLLGRVGAGTPDFRDALNGALKNEQFRNYLLSDAGSEAFSQSLAVLGDGDFIEKMKTQFGLDDNAINSLIDKVGTDVLTRIGKGEFDGKFDQLGDHIKTSVATQLIEQKLDALVAERPELATLAGHIKGDPAFMRSLANAYLQDETVGPGIEAMLKGEGGLDMDKLNALFGNAGARATFARVLDKVATDDDLKFDFVKDITTKIGNGDMSGAIEALRAQNIEVDPSLATAADMSGFMQKLQDGLKYLVEQMPFLGDLLKMLGGFVEKIFGADNQITKFFKEVVPQGVTLAGTESPGDEFRRTAAVTPGETDETVRTAGLDTKYTVAPSAMPA